MNAEPTTTDQTSSEDLLTATYAGFAPLADRLAQLDTELVTAGASPNPAIAAKAQLLRRRIRDFEPSVTMIGQVKAGKTTLVNALTGCGGLLPADVNPWTSVVTSLHIRPGARNVTENASFKFFAEEEWNDLVQRGGRIGELANRAGADDELEKVRRQLETMREKSRERLGRRFEMLLGQSHDYDNFDADMIKRYVCLGDDFWEDAGGDREQGRFADITKTADLWLRQRGLPVSLCVRDTPGVNDTFMIREQITINTLRSSRLCVVVLAATQALTSVDLALIRMISNVKSRDVIIFVNRIDELGDPAREIPEIRASIVETLKKHDGPTDANILFGCGFWAGQAMDGGLETLGVSSAEALLSWAEASIDETGDYASTAEMVWHLSGLHALGQAIAARIHDGPGADMIAEIELELRNLDQSVAASTAVGLQAGDLVSRCRMSPAELDQALSQITIACHDRLVSGLDPLRQSFAERIDHSRQTFVSRATAAVVKHLEDYGELEVWSYDPCGLRVLLRSSFQRHIRAVNKHATACMAGAAADISALYGRAFDLDGAPAALEPAPLPRPDPPLVLGKTIALDLRSSWWSRFWRRRNGYTAYAEDFARLIHEETQPLLNALVEDNAGAFEQALVRALDDFMQTNANILRDIASGQRPPSTPPVPDTPTKRAMRPARPVQTYGRTPEIRTA